MQRLIVAITAALLVAFSLTSMSQQGAPPTSAAPGDRVGLCHATDSPTGPFVYIEVSGNGGAVADHLSHGDFLADSPAACANATAGPTRTPTATATGSRTPTVAFCHRTRSRTNPWVYIVVEPGSVSTHLRHGDFIASSPADCVAAATASPTASNTPTRTATPTPTPQ